MLISEILFYMYFRNYLASTGLESNPYNPCVANKLTHRGGTTVTIHVDYLKSSTVDPRGNDDFIQFLYCKYRDLDIVKVKTTRGKIYNYLLIPLEYSQKGRFEIYMRGYFNQMGNDLPIKLN